MTKVGQASEDSMRYSAGQNTVHSKCKAKQGSALVIEKPLKDWFGFAWAFQKMTAIPKAIASIARRSWNLEDHGDSRGREKEGAMAIVVEFYIPKNFRKPMKWVPALQRGRILEFRTQTRKSA